MLVGSGFLMETDRHLYLVSAAHVFDYPLKAEERRLRGKDQMLFFFTGRDLVQPVFGELRTTVISDDGVNLDIGALRLPDRDLTWLDGVVREPIPLAAVEEGFSDPIGESFFLAGYPTKQTDIRHVRKQVLAKTMALSLPSVSHPRYAAKKLDFRNFVALDFKRKTAQGQTLSRPNGMSGAPVWAVSDLLSGNPKMVIRGIAIEYLEKAQMMVCARVQGIRPLIEALDGASAPV